jgi:transcriptional regulator with XRE-family HTH domain
VATSIGTSVTFLGRIEAGRKLPAIGTFARLRQCLGFDANHLLDVLSQPPSPFAELGRLLRCARLHRLMTADEIAEEVDCPVERYRYIESGAELPTTITFARLHRLLEFEADEALRAVPLHPAIPSEDVSCPYLEFGGLLRQARVKRRLAHADLIRAVGGTETYWTRMEAGLHVPSTRKLAALHRCLGFDANQLLGALHQERVSFQAFGQLLGDARQRCNLAPAHVASAAGCTVEHYQRVERGTELPSIMMLVRLHRVLAFSADRLLLAIPQVPARVPFKNSISTL